MYATPAWSDVLLVREMYAEARKLTVDTGVPHHVDHVIPLKHPRVCGLHAHTNLQILTADMNTSKGNKLEDWDMISHEDA